MKFRSLLLVCFALTVSLFAAANTTPGNGEGTGKCDLLGGVIDSDSKKPLGNVTVTAYTQNKKEKVVVTDSNGNYSFDELEPGTFKFVFEKSSYKKLTKEKTIVRVNEAFELNVQLEGHSSYDFMPGPSQFFDFE